MRDKSERGDKERALLGGGNFENGTLTVSICKVPIWPSSSSKDTAFLGVTVISVPLCVVTMRHYRKFN